MTLLHQAAQKAVEALTSIADFDQWNWSDRETVRQMKVIARAALESAAIQQQPEPVAPYKPAGAPMDVWNSPFYDLQKRLEICAGAVAFERKVAENMRRQRDEAKAALSALQQQEVPREPAIDADTLFGLRRYLNDVLAEGTVNERVVAQTALRMIAMPLAASPSTTQQQEAGSGCVQRIADALWARQDQQRQTDDYQTGYADALGDFVLAAAPSTPESAEKDDAGGVPAAASRHGLPENAHNSVMPRDGVQAVYGSPAPKPPCTVCGKPYEQHGTYPTCASHPYTPGGRCEAVGTLARGQFAGVPCPGAECTNGCVRAASGVPASGLGDGAEQRVEAAIERSRRNAGVTVHRQYFYKVDGCTAKDSKDPSCICWHDEGTGPLANSMEFARNWRDAHGVPEAGPNDTERLEWLTRHVSGKALREAGVSWPAWSLDNARAAIDAARNAGVAAAPAAEPSLPDADVQDESGLLTYYSKAALDEYAQAWRDAAGVKEGGNGLS